MYRRLVGLSALAVSLQLYAGNEGYLRYCPPLSVRFAEPAAVPPPVNDLILALDLPAMLAPDDTPAADEWKMDTGEETFGSQMINELITGLAPALPKDTTKATPEPDAISAAEGYEDLKFPDIPVPDPTHQQTEAQTIESLLLLFKGKGDRRSPSKGAVIGLPVTVSPPEFTPPKSSSSTHIVE